MDKSKNKLFAILKKHIKAVLLIYVAGIGCGILFYVLAPKYYLASATILKPIEDIGNIETKSKGSSDVTSNKIDTGSELFLSILKSRTMFDELIGKFDLTEVYRTKNTDRVRELFQENCNISQEGTNIIRITVIDKNPDRAAQMANFFWQNLDKLIQELTVTSAKKNRLFIEERLASTDKLIGGLENQLDKLQHENKLLAVKDTGELSELASQLMNQLAAKKLDLQRSGRVYQSDQPEITALKNEIQDLQGELDRLTGYQKKLSDLLRQIKSQETVFSFLTSQLEEAKIDESKDTPFVQVLDKAVAPIKVYRPNIKLLTGILSVTILGIGVLVLFFDLLKFLGTI